MFQVVGHTSFKLQSGWRFQLWYLKFQSWYLPTVKELRQLAKESGTEGYSELNKTKLLKQNPHRIDKKIARTGGRT